jgi:aldehyde dehydrogenase (NAD+)
MTATVPLAKPDLSGERRMLINGQLVEAEGGRTFDNRNPATEELLGVVADGSATDMQHAIASARRTFDETDWSRDHALRKRCLEQLQAAVRADHETFRDELVAEVGAPRMLTYAGQFDRPVQEFTHWPDLLEDFQWERELPAEQTPTGTNRRYVVKEPVGVVGAIVPWNFPLSLALGKLGPSIAAGNTTVLKPAPDTPWNATHLGRLIAEKTDIPPGVVNVVTSSDPMVAEQLTLSPLVDMISFTGSTSVGKRIAEKGAATMKRLFLELGGKSAMIVLDDAEIAHAVLPAAMICMHAGQGCVLPSRLLLPRSHYAEGVDAIQSAMAAVRYGDPNDLANIMGPLINEKQRRRVLGYIENGRAEGARLILGGGVPEHLPAGHYVEPTLFVDVDPSMTIAQEEIFGPVLTVIPYDDDDDAVRIANSTIYGLGGFVQTSDPLRGAAMARRIRSGAISVNNGNFAAADAPFGGFKSSGIGRQGGVEGFESYLETKTVALLTS